MKYFIQHMERLFHGPAPHGAGGLKSAYGLSTIFTVVSRPARGGWIEIIIRQKEMGMLVVPPRTGRVD